MKKQLLFVASMILAMGVATQPALSAKKDDKNPDAPAAGNEPKNAKKEEKKKEAERKVIKILPLKAAKEMAK